MKQSEFEAIVERLFWAAATTISYGGEQQNIPWIYINSQGPLNATYPSKLAQALKIDLSQLSLCSFSGELEISLDISITKDISEGKRK